MPWVQYDSNNVISGVCANKQNGAFTEVFLPDDDPIVLAYVNPAPAPRIAQLKADARRSALLARLKTATPAQIDAYLAANVTSLATARDVLGDIIKILALIARE